MILRSYMFRKVTIVGVGLMGGSLGMAIKKRGLAKEVVGLSHRQSSLVEAIKLQAIDIGFTDVAKAIRGSDLVVLAAPVDSIIKLFSKISKHLKRGCIVTDLGSAKSDIVEEAEKSLSNPSFFVGSHPLAGSEKKGVTYATSDLFENSLCLMTPTQMTNQVAKEKIKHLWAKLGAEVKLISPEEHDEILAYVSHLPHLLAYGLMETISKDHLEFSSQGLKDTTRIASSSPQMWNDICIANSRNIIKALDGLINNLSILRKAIVSRDQKSLIHYFTKAKEKRDGNQSN